MALPLPAQVMPKRDRNHPRAIYVVIAVAYHLYNMVITPTTAHARASPEIYLQHLQEQDLQLQPRRSL